MCSLAIAIPLLFATSAVPHDPACVTNVADFAKLTWADHVAQRKIQITGSVLATTPWTISICSGSKNTVFECPTDPQSETHAGDTVRITGHLVIDAAKRHTKVCDSIEVVARGRAQTPLAIRTEDLGNLRLVNRLVTIRGIVTSVNHDEFDPMYNWLVFRTQSGNFCCAVFERQHPFESLKALVDSEVEAEGLVAPLSDFRMSQGLFVSVHAANGLRVLRPSVGDHFDVPLLSNGRNDLRQRLSGVVTASCANRFFVANDQHACLAVYPADTTFIPKPGSEVLIAGYATSGLFDLQIADALVKVTSEPPHPLAQPTADLGDVPPDLHDPDKVAREYQGRIVRVEGVVLPPDEGDTDAGRIALVSNGRRFQIDASGFPYAAREALRPSATAEVVGLCLAEYEAHNFSTGFYRFRGFTVVPRQASDIRVIKSPPWWTVGKMFVVILILTTAILVVLVWNRALQTLSERRGKQLYRERIEHERATLKIEERTRLAIELHDSISQTLTGVALQIESASRANANSNATVNKFLQTGIWMLASCRRELKSCLWDLHRRTFEEKDMTEAIIRTIEPHKGDATVVVRFNVARKRFSESSAHMILRIIRELVSNAIRHGGATRIQIAGELRDGLIRFSVRDNGCGFDVTRIPGPAQGHFGLLGIHERLRQRGGDIVMNSTVGIGTKMTVCLRAEALEEHEKQTS